MFLFIKKIINFTIISFFIFLMQILIFSNPIFVSENYLYIYILFVLLYPYKWNKYIFLFFSFLIGLIMDIYMNTDGIHAFSTTLSSFFRFYLFRFFNTKNNFLENKSIYNFSFVEKLFFVFSLIIIHNMSLFILELIKKTVVLNREIFLRVLLNSIFTSIFCIICFFFCFRKERI